MPDIQTCRSCSATLPEDAAFCPKCAAPISADSAPTDPLLSALERATRSQYEVMRLLGRGGMGAVYLARDNALERLVAIKVLPPGSGEHDSTERFRREARTAAKLNHPNIVPLYTFGEGEGIMYFVMGYVSGESLGAELKRKGKIESEETRRILGEVAGALHYAHQQGVVHRDIKPDNILIEDETGKPMLTDFGVAKSVASGETLTQIGTTLGTPHYMSPEQAAGEKEIDGRSDLYSLGVVGYQILSGRLPFEGDNVREVMVQHVTKEPVALKTLVPSLPDDLARIVTQCLAKEPDERVANGQSIQNAFGVASAAEEEVPEEIEAVATELQVATYTALGSAYVAIIAFSSGNPVLGVVLSAASGLLGLGALVTVRRRPKSGPQSRYTGRDLLYWALKKPRWWKSWWPRFLRRPDDLWDRYPKEVKKQLNAGLHAMISMLPYSVGFFAEVFADRLSITSTLITSALAAPFLARYGWHAIRLWWWARRLGLDTKSIWKFFGPPPPTSSFWKRPEIQRLLLPPGGANAAVDSVSQTPTGYLQALSDAAHKLDGPRRDIAGEAASVGREILNAIEALDRQIEDLAADSDPAELARLKQKLDVLGEPVKSEPESKLRMRDLLRQQLDLAQSLADQLEAANERRARLLDMLKTLWLQVANLKAPVDDAAFDSKEISGKIRAVGDDIRRHVEASKETERVLLSNG